ncbi:MAG: hypothetical protein Q8919_03725 [Bacteroidota bacterium]|nr:hypothetical protein [Bacteroidota bacterium]
MTARVKFGRFAAALSALVLLCTSTSFAQIGTLRGGRAVLSNGTNAITLTLPGSPKTWTLTLPVDTANGLQYIFDDGTGNLHWGVPVSATSTGTVLYNVSGPQVLNDLGVPLFNIGYQTTDSGPAVGALINVVGNGGSNTSFEGLTDTARNIKNANVNAGIVVALVDTVGNSGTGTQTGLQVTVSGGGTNYAVVTTGGNVGIGTGAPVEQLEVSGNVRISGVNGLKVTEGANGTMGLATLAAGTVVVNTTKVTATSRILLTAQKPGGVVGMPYVSARTAGTSFTITSTSNTDTSDIAWIIIQP